MQKLDKITPMEKDFGKWYTDVVKNGNLIQYGLVRGTIIFKPSSYGIWEQVQKRINHEFNKLNIKNVYLPLLMPLSYLQMEKDHIEGFSSEVALVSKLGTKNLSESLVIRPTSEVSFTNFFKLELNSNQELPFLFNQWSNVVRCEKTTNPFLRTSEFLWQEGHTIHETAIEAQDFSTKMLNVYSTFFRDYLAIPTIAGRKTEREKFAGAKTTLTIEAMMKDGKALQSGTSHDLAQNFTSVFNVKYKTKDNKFSFPYQTSWGISTRLIGGIIMTHGDNRGLVIPPKIAPIQVDILLLFPHKNPDIILAGESISKIFIKAGIRHKIDASSKMPGFKAAKSEIEGSPLRIEIGPRDLAKGEITLVRRDTLVKQNIELDQVEKVTISLLNNIQDSLLSSAIKRLNENIVKVNSYAELKEQILNNRFVLAYFDGSKADEEFIQKETFATARCVPEKFQTDDSGECIITNKQTKRIVLFARAY